MKGWALTDNKTLTEQEIAENVLTDSAIDYSKVKIIKSLITASDVLRYSGELSSQNVILGSYGIGIVTESGSNLFGLEKGKHVYIEPYKACGECYNCKNGEENKCSNLMIAGEDYSGFLADFAEVESGKLFLLPDSVTDQEALFVGHISLAISIIDKLGIQKGDYVAVIGANNLGNILSQLLIYYQAVPILISNNPDNIEIAKSSGIYYTLGENDNWQKEVSALTGGRMAKHVVYFSESNIHANKAFSVASFNADVAFTGDSYKNNLISFSQAIKKQLDIHCINASSGNTAASINLIANKAIDLTHLKLDSAKYDEVPQTFKYMAEKLETEGFVNETIVDLI